MQRTHNISVTELNPFLICGLCKGYLIDATTLVDCLHSFCRSCLLKFFVSKSERHCPVCNNGPLKKFTGLEFMRQDRHLQSIVYKLVPMLFKDEMKRRKDFYETHALDDSKQATKRTMNSTKSSEKSVEANGPDSTTSPPTNGETGGGTTAPDEEMFSVCLHFIDSSSAPVPNGTATPSTPILNSSSASTSPSTTNSASAPSTSADPSPNTTATSNTSVSASELTTESFISGVNPLTFHLLCPAVVTVGMLQKFVRLKFDLNSTNSSSGNRFDVHLFCGDFFDEALPSSYTLHEVACISLWRRNAPLELAYSIFAYPQDQSTLEEHGKSRTGPENNRSENSIANGLSNGHHNSKQRIVNGVA